MVEEVAEPLRATELFIALGRLGPARRTSSPVPRMAGAVSVILDAVTLLAACDNDLDGLQEMCQDLQAFAPSRLAEVIDVARAEAPSRRKEAAHKLCGLLSAFSSVAGTVASDLEDRVAAGQLDQARSLVRERKAMNHQLLGQADGLSLDHLPRAAETLDTHGWKPGA